MRRLSNKASVVLNWLQQHEGEHACIDIAAAIHSELPCTKCNGSGNAGDGHRLGCSVCYGRGLLPFGYGDAYICLRQLVARGLVQRRKVLNEWGDETGGIVFRAVSATLASSDELEALWNLPPAQK